MVAVSISDSTLHLRVEGMHKLWAIKSSLDIPLEHVSGVSADPPGVHDWWKGIRWGGTMVPGVLIAGTFLYHGDRVFWDVNNPDMAIGISLNDEHYNELIIEVENPGDVIEMIQAALQENI